MTKNGVDIFESILLNSSSFTKLYTYSEDKKLEYFIKNYTVLANKDLGCILKELGDFNHFNFVDLLKNDADISRNFYGKSEYLKKINQYLNEFTEVISSESKKTIIMITESDQIDYFSLKRRKTEIIKELLSHFIQENFIKLFDLKTLPTLHS